MFVTFCPEVPRTLENAKVNDQTAEKSLQDKTKLIRSDQSNRDI